jgi:predicted TPR repeat methyltransferase
MIDCNTRMANYKIMSNSDDHAWLKQGSTSSGDVAQAYDDWAASYDETLASWNYRAPERAASLLRDKIAPDADIIDVGCGTGLTGTALRAAGFQGAIDGIDISPLSLEEAAKLQIYRALIVGDLQKPPLAVTDNSYDALMCVGVLTYVPDSDGILREFARLTRPGGQVLISQRDDLFAERNYEEIITALVEEGLFDDFGITGPEPYLPENPDFGSDIKVIYAALTVAG